MKVDLPLFKNGEQNSESVYILEHELTPLMTNFCICFYFIHNRLRIRFSVRAKTLSFATPSPVSDPDVK